MNSTLLKAQKKKTKLLSATDFLHALTKKEITVTDYLKRCLNNIDLYENDIHAWVSIDREAALERADFLDRSLDKNIHSIGKTFSNKLYGVPVGVKDIFNTEDSLTQHGSPLFNTYTPGNDARVVTDIRRSHGIILGKTVTAELAVHTPGPTKNPLDRNRTPGTSSSGSAAAVACGMVPLALSSQTNGSTIRPASYCGIIGFKPSFGVLPRTAMLKTTDTLDTVGIMGTALSDILMLFNVLRVEGPNYPIVNKKLLPYPKLKKKWQVGVIRNLYSDFLSPEVSSQFEEVSDHLSEQGCDVIPIELPKSFSESYKVHTTLYHRALAYYFKREWQANSELFSERLSKIIDEGNHISVADYQQACSIQTQFIYNFDAIFDQFDVLICPSAATEAPIGTDENVPLDYNHLITLCHVPAFSLPLMEGESGLPVGLQCVARKYYDYKLFDFCDFVLKSFV